MNNNDILRRIRYTFDISDSKMIDIFALAEYNVNRSKISDWLKKDGDPDYLEISSNQLSSFLDGFIIDKRGKREDGKPVPKVRLNNNVIFRKLKIALNLKDDDILELFELVDLRISKHELSSFFRKPTQSQYRLCQDQFLRNFLHGLQIKEHSK